ncbi:Holliday junction resolvase [Mycobacteroides abscessus subsp. abscessus]|nr:Holliday junction resolvase [Mycobacteroides abscessus subsp. abscessus]
MTTFFVPGVPRPQGSKKSFGRGRMVESSRHVKGWRATISAVARSEASPLSGPVEVEILFIMPRPKATSRRRPTPPAIKRPDIDKLERAVLDGLTGLAWRDDSQVVDLHSRKRIAEPDEQPGVQITYRPSSWYAELAEMCGKAA